jgi:hypothetical protein
MKKYFIIGFVVIIMIVLFFLILGHRFTSFTADIDGVTFNADRSIAVYTSGRFQIMGTQTTVPDTVSVIIVFNATKVGTYMLNDDNIETGNGAYYHFRGKPKGFITDSNNIGNVTLTKLDLEEMKVSGTFIFRAIQFDTTGSKIINVTNGVFKDVLIKIE